MNRLISSSSLTLSIALVCAATGIGAVPVAQAAGPTPAPGTVNLLTTPPELTSKVAPNVVLTFDDSGSMGRNYMPDRRPYTGAAWGATDQQNTSGSQSWNRRGSPYLCAGVIDPRVTDPADPRSWAMNGVYYNPNSTYLPPLKADGVSAFPDARFTAAWDNGILPNRPVSPTSSSTRNLGSGTRFCGNTAGYYRLKSSVTLTLDADGRISNTGTLYTPGNWEWVPLPVAEQQNFANWYSYYHTRYTASVSSVSRAYASFDKGIRVAWQNINTRQLSASTRIYPFEDAAVTTRTDFYNWLFSTPVGGNTPNQTAANRVGQFYQRATGASDTNPYWERATGRELSCRKNFHIQMTDGLWNNSTVSVTRKDTIAIGSLPDGRSYSTTDLQSKIFWNETATAAAQNTMANIAFHYWATDLRPDFQGNPQTKLKVRPYLADRTTGITGSTPLQPGDNWLDNKELYWNPANDPATWPHMVQFMIGLGVSGTIPQTAANYLKLRQGDIQWPGLIGSSPYSDTNEKIDDMWHAGLNSRGDYISAASPDDLINALRRIIASVVAQSSSSTPAAVSLPIMTGGNSAYRGGYDTSGWPGSLRRMTLDAAGQPDSVVWDAGCLLTGGSCADPAGTNPVRDPNSRIMVTSDGAAGGRPFRWASLTSAQQNALNQKPGMAPCTGTGPNCDGYGSDRVDYLRGKRDNETAPATPLLRQRQSLLGAVINGEPAYVSSPRGGYHDMFPAGSPEATAATSGQTYAQYQNAQRARRPMAYVGANDGMLHAFDADSGAESWAFVPDTVIRNGRLAAATVRDADLVPGVDAKPRERDVFINGRWRTVLVGSLRLGGRGVYALDVTAPSQPDETTAAGTNGVVMWEFSSGDVASAAGDPPCSPGARSCASLGYTYDSINIARLKYDDKWVALVSTGYFPENVEAAARDSDRFEAAASRTSLLVIDLATGTLIKELRTSQAPQTPPAGFKTFGLSTPMVFDVGSNEVDDLAYAGDLAGNLWRFDLSADDPNDWKVDLMFTTYGSGGAAAAGDQPIVFNPTALADPVTRSAILVFGTGKYLGEDDRTSLIPQQAFYGIRDYGTASAWYPIKANQLITQTIAQDGNDVRSITGYTNPGGTLPSAVPPMRMGSVDASGDPIVTSVAAHGWRMRLNIATERGERAQRRAIPIVTANVALLYGLIPKSDDPCDPGARYSIMAIDAATGAAIPTAGGIGSGRGLIGAVVTAPEPPSDPVIKRGGGGGVIVGLPAGIPIPVREAIDQVLSAAIPIWHRSGWRELLNQ